MTRDAEAIGWQKKSKSAECKHLLSMVEGDVVDIVAFLAIARKRDPIASEEDPFKSFGSQEQGLKLFLFFPDEHCCTSPTKETSCQLGDVVVGGVGCQQESDHHPRVYTRGESHANT